MTSPTNLLCHQYQTLPQSSARAAYRKHGQPQGASVCCSLPCTGSTSMSRRAGLGRPDLPHRLPWIFMHGGTPHPRSRVDMIRSCHETCHYAHSRVTVDQHTSRTVDALIGADFGYPSAPHCFWSAASGEATVLLLTAAQ